jgi:ParB family chromosome partitioning protein
VANVLRLLKLPDEVRGNIAAGELSMGHARAILGMPNEAAQRRVARDVITHGWSVRETEALVKKEAAGTAASTPHAATSPAKDVHTRAAEEQLHLALGTAVIINRKRKGGTVEIAFANEDELQRIYEYLTERR